MRVRGASLPSCFQISPPVASCGEATLLPCLCACGALPCLIASCGAATLLPA